MMFSTVYHKSLSQGAQGRREISRGAQKEPIKKVLVFHLRKRNWIVYFGVATMCENHQIVSLTKIYSSKSN